MNEPETRPRHMQCTGAILAGGRSSRMGRPKQDLVLPDGRTMIEHVYDALSRVCSRVVIVGTCEALPSCARLADLNPGLGPLAGIEALLASGIDEQYVACPCDMPFLTPTAFEALLKPGRMPLTVLCVRGRDQFEPLPIRVAAEALASVRAHLQSGRRSMHEVIESMEHECVELDASHAGALTNINTIDEYRRLMRQ